MLMFAICLSGTGLLYAQTDTADRTPELIPYRIGDKWGYADRNKKIVIPVKYDYADVFREGLGKVTLNKKTGFIDKNGKEIFRHEGYFSKEAVEKVLCDAGVQK